MGGLRNVDFHRLARGLHSRCWSYITLAIDVTEKRNGKNLILSNERWQLANKNVTGTR